jgi:hypothetical protein
VRRGNVATARDPHREVASPPRGAASAGDPLWEGTSVGEAGEESGRRWRGDEAAVENASGNSLRGPEGAGDGREGTGGR